MENDKEGPAPTSADEEGVSARRAELEIAKLEGEVNELGRPWFKRPIVYVNSIVALTALVGVAGQSLLSSIKAERTLLLSEKAKREAEEAIQQKEHAIAESQEARAELEVIKNSVRVALESLEAARGEAEAARDEAQKFERRAAFARAELSRLEALVKRLAITPTDKKVLNEFADESLMRQVIEITAAMLGLSYDKVTPESHFVDDLGADSLDMVELVMAMEEEFELGISDEAAEKIVTVQDAFNYIRNQLKGEDKKRKERISHGGGRLVDEENSRQGSTLA